MQTQPNHSARTRVSLALVVIAIGFWPAFMLLTVLEEKVPLPWLRTGDSGLWIPLVGIAFGSGLAAPFFAPWSLRRRLLGSISAALAFAIMYGIVAWFGVAFLDWGD